MGLKQKLEFNLISPSGELLTPKPILSTVDEIHESKVNFSSSHLVWIHIVSSW